ncbi:hypothetical protein ACH5RR_029287 [Cinchona calisaya]|uniref:Cytochrome P450 n=1 Tax=Cinchona calisaya TaxID=153742 RepID=A0ABD2YR79_9GENT
MAVELPLLSLKIALVGVVALIFVLFFLLGRFKPKKNLPPEVGGAWPIIGHLHLLGDSKPTHIIFAAMADKYGPAFTVRLGQYRTLVVSSWELIKELYNIQDTVALDRPKSSVAKTLGYDYAMFGFCPYGPYWREIRKLVVVELLSVRRLELLKHIRISETEIGIKELYKLWNKKRNVSSSSKGHVLVEMKQWFEDLTLNVILRMVAGKRYFGDVDLSEDREARKCQEVLKELFRLIGLFLVSDSIPLLKWLDWGGYEKKIKVISKEMDQIADGWLREHRQKKEFRKDTGGDHQNFMDVMISLLDGAENSAGYDADTITKATCLNLIAGGSDTTSATLSWAVALLLNNPRVLKKVQEELDFQVGRERQVSESDIPDLVYLQAMVNETLRLYPPGALGGIREFTEDSVICGYHIPKGTRLLPNLWKLHRDPKVWPEPLEFRPERFLTTHKDIDVKGHHFELIPFTAGRRICPGMNFGLQMLHFVLANLLHSFDISTPFDEAIDMTEAAGLVNHKVIPLQVLLAPRLSPELY